MKVRTLRSSFLIVGRDTDSCKRHMSEIESETLLELEKNLESSVCNLNGPSMLLTARYFLTRALLAAENFIQAQEILQDSGCGAGDAFSINMTFLNQEGDRLFHNAEVGPAVDGANESALSIVTASPGEHIFHCNK
jgi:hypothetical protein